MNKKIFWLLVAVVIASVVTVIMYSRWRKNKWSPENITYTNEPIKRLPHTIPSPAVYDNLPDAFSIPLKIGQRNKAVYLLQWALNTLNNAGLVLDGNFGTATQKAVMDYSGHAEANETVVNYIVHQVYANRKHIPDADFFINNIHKLIA